ncbi:hydantoinase B/oxoprolinase family protein [Thermogymnomonas acidicola]|uniref:hydantoinase B/oxoprolinase family protein n=1 Tax=Thermogymnomonas acidicola TaxID=399579 RepID=UPI000946687D|nr:hydantoinase B/oxoprolinase family protein [Thermogymnomonas acidicola]
MRIGRDDRIDEEIVRIIEANSRTPEMTLGDMEAQVASMRVARNRILRLIDRYGSEAVRASVESSILAGEMKARELLRALPHGSFEIEDFIDDDGINEEPIRVRARLTVTDDEFLVDFTGSSRSVRGGSINSPYPATVSSVRTVFVAASDPHTEPNGGFFRPVKVVAPEGSIFNPPVRPAPTSTYWESMSYAGGDLVWHILAELIPDKLSAGHFLTVGATIVAAWTTGQGGGESRSQSWNRSQVAGGASFDRDGESAWCAVGGTGGRPTLLRGGHREDTAHQGREAGAQHP